MNHRLALAGAALALAASGVHAQTPEYTYRAFFGTKGTPPTIMALAPDGSLAGAILPWNGVGEAFAFVDGRQRAQPIANARLSYLAGIDAHGNSAAAADGQGYFRTADGRLQPLDPHAVYGLVPSAMNGHDVIVGTHYDGQTVQGFTWQKGQATKLPTPGIPDIVNVQPTAINDAGTIVGFGAGVSSNSPYAWIDGSFRQLPTLDPAGGYAKGVSSTGTIVGASFAPAANSAVALHACAWRDGQPTDLGAPLGGATSVAEGANAAGDVVGTTMDWNYNPLRGVLWRGGSASAAVALDTLVALPAGWTIVEADFINDAGQIVANAQTGTQLVPLLLTPIAH